MYINFYNVKKNSKSFLGDFVHICKYFNLNYLNKDISSLKDYSKRLKEELYYDDGISHSIQQCLNNYKSKHNQNLMKNLLKY